MKHWLEARDAWTDERIAEMRRLSDEGLSRGQIAAAMGVTRNTICGKMNRLGIVNNPRPKRTRTQPTIPPVTPEQVQAINEIVAPEFEEDGWMTVETDHAPNTFTIMDLTNTSCRWPVGNVLPQQFCGCNQANMVEGRPYCPGHRRMSYVGTQTRRSVYAVPNYHTKVIK